MKNTISIVPADDEMKIFVEAIAILNRFKAAGFDTRRAFVDVVAEKNPFYDTHENILKLYGFWAKRVTDEQLNADLLKILVLIETK